MPTRLGIVFPGKDGAKDITFTCDSGDYDPGPELDDAIKSVVKRLAPPHGGWHAAELTREDV